ASALHNLGALAIKTGDVIGAQSYVERAIDTLRAAGASEERIARSAILLGPILYQRGDLAGAESGAQQALPVLDPEPRMPTLLTLGMLAWDRADWEVGDDYARRAEALAAQIEPGGQVHVAALVGLGRSALARDDLDQAEKRFQESLAAAERSSPTGSNVAQ